MLGVALSLSGNGSWLAVGGDEDDSGTGATWIFSKDSSASSYKQSGLKLVANGSIGAARQGKPISAT